VKPVVLVTGTSSGIGRAAAGHLSGAGCQVVATARDPAAIQDLVRPGVEAVRLDVADPSARRDVVAAVVERHGRIDVLVNNAGYGMTLAAEETPVEAVRAMFEVNLFAAHDLARQVLPAMRARGHGRIVNVASIAGHVAVPFLGAYCASKFALRALTQCMDNEVRRFGVRALLVEPGVIRTPFGQRSQREARAALPDPEASPYAPQYRRWDLRRAVERGARPEAVARRIVRCCLASHPSLHNFVPWQAGAANLLRRALPDAWIDAGMRAYMRGR
jgi:NAD(P)-dependent dehydrogenase (short-subunit alcohol dehydrogenase family)